VSDQGAPGFTERAAGRRRPCVRDLAGRAHRVIAYQFVGFTGAMPLEEDGQSTLGFLARPDLNRVLASTSFLVDESTGELIESDIFFNTAFHW
jgi:hypothetical protein